MSVASQLLRTFPPNPGTSDRHNRAVLTASLILESRARTARTEAPLVSVFVLQVATSSALLPIYFTLPSVFSQYFIRALTEAYLEY